MKKILTVVALALGISICCSASILRDAGPCYGYGCPALSASNKPYDAKANKDQKAKDDTVNADKDAKPEPDQQTPSPKAAQ